MSYRAARSKRKPFTPKTLWIALRSRPRPLQFRRPIPPRRPVATMWTSRRHTHRSRALRGPARGRLVRRQRRSLRLERPPLVQRRRRGIAPTLDAASRPSSSGTAESRWLGDQNGFPASVVQAPITPVPASGDAATLVARLKDSYARADAALRSGDFAGYAAELALQKQLLDNLQQVIGTPVASQLIHRLAVARSCGTAARSTATASSIGYNRERAESERE